MSAIPPALVSLVLAAAAVQPSAELEQMRRRFETPRRALQPLQQIQRLFLDAIFRAFAVRAVFLLVQLLRTPLLGG